jgi:hypothetical protein
VKTEDAGKLKTLLNALFAAFRVEASEPIVMAYTMGLRDLAIEEIEAGVSRAFQESRMMPSIAEVSIFAGHGVVNSEALATQAWSAILDAMRRYGTYASVDFGPRINHCVRLMGGWQALGQRESADIEKWARIEFGKIWAATEQVEIAGHDGRHLEGHHEVSQIQHGADYKVKIHRITVGPERKQLEARQAPKLRSLPAPEPEMTDAQAEENRKRVAILVAKIGG